MSFLPHKECPALPLSCHCSRPLRISAFIYVNKDIQKICSAPPSKFSSVQFSRCRVRLFTTPWIAARPASLSITNSRSSLRLTSIESVMPSSHLILCRPLLLLPTLPNFQTQQLAAFIKCLLWALHSVLSMYHSLILSTNVESLRISHFMD